MRASRRGARRGWLIAFALWAALAQRGAHWPAQPPPHGLGLAAAAWPSATELRTLGARWYYVYSFAGDLPPAPQRVLLIPVDFDEAALQAALRAHPGAWWLVGNEPNDPAQDNLSPGAYAAFYRRASALVRRVDPSAQLAPAGLANADWGWAHDFRESYRAQYGRYPHVDAWNIHNYILEPERSPYDLPEFQRRVLDFRTWMARVGEGDKPLILSEFGLLQRNVPSEQASAFLQAASDWLAGSGQVQAWAWFSNYTAGAFGGDLLDAQGALTPLGEAYRREAPMALP